MKNKNLLMGLILVSLLSSCGLAAVIQEDKVALPVMQSDARVGKLAQGAKFSDQVARAVMLHPSLSASASRIQAAYANADAVRADLLPTISLGVDLIDTSSGRGSLTPAVRITQLLFDGGGTRARLRGSRTEILRQYYLSQALANELTLSVVRAHIEVRHQKRLVALSNENLRLHRQHESHLKDMIGAGAGSEVDAFVAQSRTADARTRVLERQRLLGQSRSALRELFGEIDFVDVGPIPLAPSLPAGNTRNLAQSSPNYLSLKRELEAATHTLEASRAARTPSAELVVDGRRNTATDQNVVSASVSPRLELGGGRRKQAAVERDAARVAELSASLVAVERQIIRAIDDFSSERGSGQSRVNVARAAQRANAAYVDAVKEQFETGRKGIDDILDAQRDLYQASVALEEAKRDLLLSSYGALGATGDLLDVFNIDVNDVFRTLYPERLAE